MQDMHSLPMPERVRQVPKRFSWVDHRLIREGYVTRCSCESLGLYLVLVTVSDCNGVSYYRDDTLGRMISCPSARIKVLREELIKADLLAFCKPFYQVLSFDRPIFETSSEPAMVSSPEKVKEELEEPATPEEIHRIVSEGRRRMYG